MLYPHVGDPAGAVDFDESLEGHHLRFDAAGRLVGITLLHPHAILGREGRIAITIPEHIEELAPDALQSALDLAA